MGMAAVVCLLAWGAVAEARASARAPLRVPARAPLRFREHFSALPYVGVQSSGRYTLFQTAVQGEAGVVFDELTGRRTAVWLPSDCPAPDPDNLVLGGAWLLEDCTSTRVDLYPLAGGDWRPVRVAPGCVNFHAGLGSSCDVDAIGSDWIEYDESSALVGDRFVFQNIDSGALRHDPASAGTLADLSSPRLRHRLCRPLRASPGESMIGLPERFALALTEAGAALERCGTRRRHSVDFDDGSAADTWSAGDARTLVWDPGGSRLDGLFLPSLRRFTLSASALRSRAVGTEIVSDRHIYYNVVPDSPTAPLRVLSAPLPQP